MELSDVVLALVSILSSVSLFIIRNITTDIKELEHNMNHCQSTMPKEYVLKTDFNNHQNNVEKKLDKLGDKLDALIKVNK